MHQHLTLRRAVPVEVEALRGLTYRAKASHGYETELMRRLAADIDQAISAEVIAQNTFMVAEVDGRIAGFAHLMPIERPDTIYLEDLYIEPDMQGMGLGGALFGWALREAGERGFAWLEWDSDPNAVGFYERMGGETIGENESTLWGGRKIAKFRLATSPRPAITFREAVQKDADLLTAICRRAKASHGYDEAFMAAVWDDMVMPAELIARDTVMVAEIEGREVGFAHLMPIDRPDTIYLENLFIEPDTQGLGVGKALFNWALTEAEARGYAWLEWDSDPNAAAFYEKVGAERIRDTESGAFPGRMFPTFRMATGSADPSCRLEAQD